MDRAQTLYLELSTLTTELLHVSRPCQETRHRNGFYLECIGLFYNLLAICKETTVVMQKWVLLNVAVSFKIQPSHILLPKISRSTISKLSFTEYEKLQLLVY